VIGATDQYRTGTGYDITPVLAMVPPDLPIQPNPDRSRRLVRAAAGLRARRGNHVRHTGEWSGRRGSYIEILWKEHRIWGVTAGIIANLAQRVRWHG